MSYKITIEEWKVEETGYGKGNWVDIYEQLVEDIDVPAIVTVVNNLSEEQK